MRKYIIVYIFLSINIFAQSSNVSIKSLVEQIKRAKPEDRRILINQLKIQLRKVNREKRKKSMLELKRSLNSKRESGNMHYQRRDHKHFREGRRFRKMIFRGHR